MKKSLLVKLMLLPMGILVVIAVSIGCSQISGPSDADIIHGVEQSMKGHQNFGVIKLTSPVEIIDRGTVIKNNRENIYPVKVRLSFVYTSDFGRPEHHQSQVCIANFIKVQDQMGKYVWQCQNVGYKL